MSDSDANTAPEELPQGDLIKILRDQHAEMQDLFATLLSTAEGRQETFDRLRRLIVSHEVAEEMILRPVSAQLVDMKIVAMLDHEELQATEAVKKLEAVDVRSKGFLELAVDLQRTMGEHADKEESLEFPRLLEGCNQQVRLRLGTSLARAEADAPTHAHPSAVGSTNAQIAAAPFAALVDRARDALAKHLPK